MKNKIKTLLGQLSIVACLLFQCGQLWASRNNQFHLVTSTSELNDSSVILIVFESAGSYFAMGKTPANKAVNVTQFIDNLGNINLDRVDSTNTPWTISLQTEEQGWLLRRKNKINGEYVNFLYNNITGKRVTNSTSRQIWNLNIDDNTAVITNSKRRLSIVGESVTGYGINAELESDCVFLLYKYVPPLVTPAPEIIQTDGEISISAQQECDIFFTINGTEPTIYSEKYSKPLLFNGGRVFVRAISVYPDGRISGESTFTVSLQPVKSGYYVMAALSDSHFLAAGQTRSSDNYYNYDSIAIAYDRAIVGQNQFIFFLKCHPSDHDSLMTYQLFHYDREVGLISKINSTQTNKPGVPDTLLWSKEKSCFYRERSNDIRYYTFYEKSNRFGFYKSGVTAVTLFPAGYSLSVPEMGYSTLYLDYPVLVPEGAKAYASPYLPQEGMVRFAMINEGVIPRNTGTLIENSGKFVFNHTESITNELDYCVNYLSGSTVRDTISEPDASCYALNDTTLETGEVQACFRALENTFTCKANRAYLRLPGRASVKGFILTDGIESSIESVKPYNALQSDIFDLRGVKMLTPGPGVYIRNGKKFIIR